MSGYCVTVTPTICDGTVVRWHAGPIAAESGSPIISASRNGVMGHGVLITPDLFALAWTAHEALKRGSDVNHLATHRRRGVLGGEFVPVEATR